MSFVAELSPVFVPQNPCGNRTGTLPHQFNKTAPSWRNEMVIAFFLAAAPAWGCDALY
jgi:hypothetical protein